MKLWDFAGEGNLEVGFEGRPVGIEIGFLLFRVRIEEYSWRTKIEVGFAGHIGSRDYRWRSGWIEVEGSK